MSLTAEEERAARKVKFCCDGTWSPSDFTGAVFGLEDLAVCLWFLEHGRASEKIMVFHARNQESLEFARRTAVIATVS